MGSSKPKYQQAAPIINGMGTSISTGMSTDMAANLAQMYGFDNTSQYNYQGSAQEVIGAGLVSDRELRRVNNINLPYQVGMRTLGSIQAANASMLKRAVSSPSQTRFTDIPSETKPQSNPRDNSLKGN